MPMTNRKGAMLLLLLLAPVVLYIVSSGWAFIPMRDGFLIGSFPIAYLGLCFLFTGLILWGPGSLEKLDGFNNISVPGLARIAVFCPMAAFLTFWHESYGFVLLCTLFVALVSWFSGQRRVLTIILYSITVSVALFAAFTLLGFDLTIAPGIKIGR